MMMVVMVMVMVVIIISFIVGWGETIGAAHGAASVATAEMK